MPKPGEPLRKAFRPMKKNRGKPFFQGLAAILGLLFAGALLSQLDIFTLRMPLAPERLAPFAGHAYTCPFRYWNPFLAAPDATVRPPGLARDFVPGKSPESGLALLFDGREKWTRQAAFDAIIRSEDGGFLHGEGMLGLSLPTDGRGKAIPPAKMEVRFPVRAKPEWCILLGAAFLASLLAAGCRASRLLPAFVRRNKSPCAIAGLGLFLLGANILGLFLPLRCPDILLGNEFIADRDPELWTEEQAAALLGPKPGQSAEARARAATEAVNRAMAYTWPESRAREYRIRVPLWENHILWALSLFSEKYFFYEFFDHKKALARGVGLCGQQAACLAGFLREAGTDARIVSMEGHVIVSAEVAPGRRILLDPAFGVVIPKSLEEACKDPAGLAAYYERHRPFRPEDRRGPLAPASLGPVIRAYAQGKPGINPYGISGYFGEKGRYAAREKIAYALKWPLPIALLLAAGLMGLGRARRRKTRAET